MNGLFHALWKKRQKDPDFMPDYKGGSWFTGRVVGGRVYDRVLSDKEIRAVWEEGPPVMTVTGVDGTEDKIPLGDSYVDAVPLPSVDEIKRMWRPDDS